MSKLLETESLLVNKIQQPDKMFQVYRKDTGCAGMNHVNEFSVRIEVLTCEPKMKLLAPDQ